MQQTSAKKRLGGESDSLGIVQEIEIWPDNQMIYAQTKICAGEWDAQNSLEFWDKNKSINRGQGSLTKKKKRKKKENRTYSELSRSSGLLSENQTKQKEGPSKRSKKSTEHECDVTVIDALETILKDLVRHCPVGLGCRIHRLHLCRGVRPTKRVS